MSTISFFKHRSQSIQLLVGRIQTNYGIDQSAVDILKKLKLQRKRKTKLTLLLKTTIKNQYNVG
jgi:hypothetical protein